MRVKWKGKYSALIKWWIGWRYCYVWDSRRKMAENLQRLHSRYVLGLFAGRHCSVLYGMVWFLLVVYPVYWRSDFLAAGFFAAFAHLGINMSVIKMMDDIATFRKWEMSLVRQAKEQKKDWGITIDSCWFSNSNTPGSKCCRGCLYTNIFYFVFAIWRSPLR